MTRTTRTATLAAAALAGGAGIGLALLHLRPPTEARPGGQPAVSVPAAPAGSPVPDDPDLLAKYRQAYRESLREAGADAMLEVLQGADGVGKDGPPPWEGARMARVEEDVPGSRPLGQPTARLGVPELPPVAAPIEGWQGPLPLAEMPQTGTPRATIREVGLTVPAAGRALVGTHATRVERRLTLVLPAGVRRQLGHPDEVMLTPEAEGYLRLAAPGNPPVVPVLLTGGVEAGGQEHRRRLARTARVALDSEGRVEVSPALAEAAGLAGDVVLIGGGDHFEVWDAARWKAARDSAQEKLHGP